MDLHQAAKKGNCKAIRQHYAAVADLNARDERGRTPLMVAARQGQSEAADLLLKLGADGTVTDRKGHTALSYALDSLDDLSIIRRLIVAGCPVNTRGPSSGSTPLGKAAAAAEVALVEALLAEGADPNQPGGYNDAPPLIEVCLGSVDCVQVISASDIPKSVGDPAENLRQALDQIEEAFFGEDEPAEMPVDPSRVAEAAVADQRRLDVVHTLLRAGADPKGADREGFTPLHWATMTGNLAIVQALLASGADPNAQTKETGETPLMRAVDGNVQPETARVLLAAGANPNLVDREAGRTALMRLVERWSGPAQTEQTDEEQPLALLGRAMSTLQQLDKLGAQEAFDALIAAGADLNLRDRQGRTALMIAVTNNAHAGVAALLAAGADVNARDHGGQTALSLSNEHTRKDIIRLLESAGADRGAAEAYAALFAACDSGDATAVQAALAAGAAVDGRDDSGRTPLERAAATGNWQAFTALQQAGAQLPPASLAGLLTGACGGGNTEVVRTLLAAGADPNAEADEDTYPSAPLCAAAASGHLDVLRMLIDAGAEVNRRYRHHVTALLVAAEVGQQATAELLKTAGASDPRAEAFLSLAHFAPTAEQPRYREWIDRLTSHLGGQPTRIDHLPGVCVFQASNPFDEDAQPLGAKTFKASWEADRQNEERFRAMVEDSAWGGAVRADGYHLIRTGAAVGGKPFLMLLPTADRYAVLAALRPDGCNHEVSTADIIAWLMEMEQTDPFVLTGCGRDWVEGRFLNPVSDPRTLAKRMEQFCPDIVSQGCGTVKKLAKSLSETGRLYFWWD